MRKKYNKMVISICSIIVLVIVVILGARKSNFNVIEERTNNKEVTNVMASPSDVEYHTYMGTRKFR